MVLENTFLLILFDFSSFLLFFLFSFIINFHEADYFIKKDQQLYGPPYVLAASFL